MNFHSLSVDTWNLNLVRDLENFLIRWLPLVLGGFDNNKGREFCQLFWNLYPFSENPTSIFL